MIEETLVHSPTLDSPYVAANTATSDRTSYAGREPKAQR